MNTAQHLDRFSDSFFIKLISFGNILKRIPDNYDLPERMHLEVPENEWNQEEINFISQLRNELKQIEESASQVSRYNFSEEALNPMLTDTVKKIEIFLIKVKKQDRRKSFETKCRSILKVLMTSIAILDDDIKGFRKSWGYIYRQPIVEKRNQSSAESYVRITWRKEYCLPYVNYLPPFRREIVNVLGRIEANIESVLRDINYYISIYKSIINKYFDTESAQETTKPNDDKATVPLRNNGLSAPQKLLFIRLLQMTGQFPQKPSQTDDAPELRAIALLTGLDYNNDIKGGNGANKKVNQILNGHRFTRDQLPHKISDLDAVENVARLLNTQTVISEIEIIREKLNQLSQS